jgi:pyrimidine-nucleoside phosphorylase
LGHTGGTLDKLETIPGFSVQLSLTEFQNQVKELGVAIVGQTEEICPADKRIYALRDVTATVESIPLICASIISKKLAEGIQGLVLDVKVGSGAFMKTKEQALELAHGLKQIGELSGKKVKALITSMEQPLGPLAGNSLEILECMQILKQEKHHELMDLDGAKDTEDLSVELAAWMLVVGQKERSIESARTAIRGHLESGRGYEIFEQMCRAQGGRLAELPLPNAKDAHFITAQSDGYLNSFECEQIGLAIIALGGGRLQKTDTIDPRAGIRFHKKIGAPVRRGEILFSLFAASSSKIAAAEKLLEQAVTIGLNKPLESALIWQTI